MNLSTLVSELPVDSVTYAAVPTDPASIFVYVLLLVAGIGIWKGSRSS